MSFGTYSASQVTVAFNGIPVTGAGPGTFVAWARNEESASLQVGSQGDSTISKSNNRSGRVTLTLLQSSASNSALSQMSQLFETGPAGSGIGPLLVKDMSGTTVISAENAWVVKPADGEFSNEGTTREWVLETDYLQVFNGAN